MRCRVPARLSGDSHDAGLLGQRLQNRLTDPPDGVGDELDALRLVELLRGAHESDVSLVDQVGERDALVLVALGDGDHEAEVRADQSLQGGFVADADARSQVGLLSRSISG
jgi:hypothetical protein